MPDFPPRARLRDHVVTRLASEIVAGHVRPGDPLPPEPELAAEYKISKVVVREAIQDLASLRLVHVQHGKRTVVVDESEWNILAPPVQHAFSLAGREVELTRQLYEVRIMLETSAAGWTAQRATATILMELMALVERLRHSAQERDLGGFLEADRAFHDVIAQGAGNIVLRSTIRNLHTFHIGNWLGSKVTPEQLGSLVDQHAAIAVAIEERNATKARQAMEAHLAWAAAIETTAQARDPVSRDVWRATEVLESAQPSHAP